MKWDKSRVTQLVKFIKDKWPDDGDILGFQGVSSKMLSEGLEETRELMDQVDSKEDTIDSIYLKRSLGDILEELMKLRDDNLNKPDKFNRFVTLILSLRVEVRTTYLLLQQNGLRAEAELIRTKRQNDELLMLNQELSKRLTELQNDTEEMHTKIEQLKNSEESYLAVIEKAESIGSQYSETMQRFGTMESEVETLREENNELNGRLESSEAELDSLLERNNDLKTQLEEKIKSAAKADLDLKAIIAQAIDHERQIEDNLHGSHKVGLASSFQDRMEDTDISLKSAVSTRNRALGVAFVVMGLLVALGIFGTLNTSGMAVWENWVFKFLVISPLIWIAWSESKTASTLAKIKEDYAYKFASAMAYAGYKKEASEESEDMKLQLLHVAVDNFRAHPVRLFQSEKENHTPFGELISKIVPKSASKAENADSVD